MNFILKEFSSILAVLGNSIMPMGLDSSHATLNMMSELSKLLTNAKPYPTMCKEQEVTSHLHHHEKYRMTLGKGRYAT